MTTFTEIVAVVVVHSSAAAYSHFGVVLEPTPQADRPAAVQVVARTPARRIDRLPNCPERAKTPIRPDGQKV